MDQQQRKMESTMATTNGPNTVTSLGTRKGRGIEQHFQLRSFCLCVVTTFIFMSAYDHAVLKNPASAYTNAAASPAATMSTTGVDGVNDDSSTLKDCNGDKQEQTRSVDSVKSEDSSSLPSSSGPKDDDESLSSQSFAHNPATLEKSRPYGQYCQTSVMNELQLWNPNKRVIAYALFFTSEEELSRGAAADEKSNKTRKYEAYFNGLKANVHGAALYYPDWVVRVFAFGLTPEQIEGVIQIDNSRVEVVVCHTDSPLVRDWSTRLVSRALPYDDPSVSAFLSRDSDSRFTARELLAVNQWLASDYCFHSMRDHPRHNTQVMGGMFGMKRGCIDEKEQRHGDSSSANLRGHDNNDASSTSMTSLLQQELGKFTGPNATQWPIHFDQRFLEAQVWPIVKTRAIDHDINMERCRRHGASLCATWPLGSQNQELLTYHVGQSMRSETDMASPGYACTLECQAASS